MQSPGAKIRLEVKSDGRRLLYAAREGEAIRITDPDYVVTVERIFGNFALDPKTGQAHDVGSRPFNPAVQARIEHGGRTRTALRPEHFECPVSAIPPLRLAPRGARTAYKARRARPARTVRPRAGSLQVQVLVCRRDAVHGVPHLVHAQGVGRPRDAGR